MRWLVPYQGQYFPLQKKASAISGRVLSSLCVASSQIIILMGLLANILGILPTLAGFGATLTLIPITAWTTKREDP